MRIHQLNSCLSFGDAITNHTLEMDQVLQEWGFDTHIFSEIIDGASFSNKAQPDKNYKKYMKCKDDILIFHYSVYCENINLYKNTENIKIFEYHNITPPEYVIGYDDYLWQMCKRGRDELKNLTKCNLSLGDSEYNRLELVQNGFDENTSNVLPIFLHYDEYASVERNERLMELFNDDYVNILFVGRIVPNKKIEDLIKTFYIYNKINPKSRLFLVGAKFLKKYDTELKDLIDRLKLNNVYFTDRVPLSDLKTYYELADIFLCMSEHEGFCVPLIESMYFKIPIIAYNSTAIPYTLNNTSILVNEKNYIEIAELINIVVEDKNIYNRIIMKQNERLKDFDRTKVKLKLKSIIEKANNQR